MAEIKIASKKSPDGWSFNVLVSEGGESTTHKVTLSKEYYEKLGKPYSPEELVRRSFEFLLEREPKESILSEFDLTKIGQYFPEFEGEITS